MLFEVVDFGYLPIGQDAFSTHDRLTLHPSPAPLTPLDREMSLIDPFEALRAYANQDRSSLANGSNPPSVILCLIPRPRR